MTADNVPSWLGPQRQRAVPWTGADIVGLFGLVDLFLPALAIEAVRRSYLLLWVYGLYSGADGLDRIRGSLWAGTLAFPIALLAVPLLLALRGARPYQIGLTTHRLGRNVLAGVAAWLAVTPLLMLTWYGLVWLMGQSGGAEDHPLTKLGRGSELMIDRVLLVIAAVIVAPVLEELLFRGVLLPWLTVSRRPGTAWDGSMMHARWFRQIALVGLAVGWALLVRGDKAGEAIQAGNLDLLLRELAPGLFALTLAALFLAWRAGRGWPSERKPTDAAGAIFVTSLFFAAAHSGIWPSPVPLFGLALVLGWLRYRTQSLIPSIVLHALFNGVSCVILFLPA